MSKYVVVTEGPADILLLRALLDISPDDPDITFVAAGGWSAADSYARSLLVMNEADVALVVDANSTDPDVVEDRKRFLHHSLSSIPSHKKFRIVVIVPDIAILLFRDRSLLEKLVGASLSSTDMVEAKYGAWQVLKKYLPDKGMESVLLKLSAMDLSSLKTDPALRDLKLFLTKRTKKRQAKEPLATSRL